MSEDKIELPTKELLECSAEEICGVIMKFQQELAKDPAATKRVLAENPEFARALYQAMTEFNVTTPIDAISTNHYIELLKKIFSENMEAVKSFVYGIPLDIINSFPDELRSQVMIIREHTAP